MKQLSKRLHSDGIVGAGEFSAIAKQSLITTGSGLPINLPPQYRTTASELIVQRTAGNNAAARFLLDRRNDRVLWTATRPVLLCKASGRACYRKILVPVGFTDTEAGRIAAEFAIASFPYAQIVFLHAFQEPENSLHDVSHASGDVRSKRLSFQKLAITRLLHLTDKLRSSDNLISCVAHYGPAFSVIVNYAARMSADLILIGPQEQRRLKDLLFGSAASRIANHTNADVLVMPRRMTRQGVSPAVPTHTRRQHRQIMTARSSYKF